VASEREDPEPTDSVVSRPTPGELRLGPSYAVLRALAGNHLTDATLGPETVSTKALAGPVKVATDLLIGHNKRCKRASCPHIPPTLRQYQKWRPSAIPGIADQIHKTLWTHGDHEFVDIVRKIVLDQLPEIAEAARDGRLLGGNGLDSLLSTVGEEAPRQLLAVLWALRLSDPVDQQLFRLILPLCSPVDHAQSKTTTANELKHRDRERDLREARHARKLAEQATNKLNAKILQRERALAKRQQELEQLQTAYATACDQLLATKQQLTNSEIDRDIARNLAEKTSKANAAVRQDLREASESLDDLEVRRSELAQQLAFERRYLKDFVANHRTGAPAAWDFLQREQQKIIDLRTITSGGDRQRADAEWTAHRKLRESFLAAYPQFAQSHAPRAKLLPRATLRFRALGGAGEVGRSCYLLELGKRRILVDCGIKPGATEDLRPRLDEIDHIDALLVTHAHTDHIGWIPTLVRKLGDFEIYCSNATAALLPIMLDDCQRHYRRKIVLARENARFSRSPHVVEEDYQPEHVAQVPNLVIGCEFEKQIALPFDGVSICLYPAGHVLGAAGVLLEDQSGRRVYFSGDFSSFDQLTVPAAIWPANLAEIDLLVLESTYGARVRRPQQESRDELLEIIRTTTEAGGSVILPSFALGRAQEILTLLTRARACGDLPDAVPVHFDGMIQKINPVYKKLAGGFSTVGFFEVNGEADRRELIFKAQQTPTIIVTTSGMFMGGPVIEYAASLLPDSRHRIVFSGYQDEGAPSSRLLDLVKVGSGKRTVTVANEHGDPVRIDAAVAARKVGLSAHADQAGLLEYASQLVPRTIALVHGDLEAQKILRTLLQGRHPEAEIICAPEEELEIP